MFLVHLFAKDFFSKYFAINKNRSSDSNLQLSYGVFSLVGLWVLGARLDNSRVSRRQHLFNLGNQKSSRTHSNIRTQIMHQSGHSFQPIMLTV
jgi:hypothetical protein